MAHDVQHTRTHSDESGLAELLDLDARIFHSYIDDVIEWAEHRTGKPPRRVVDLGAGTGVGSLALAQHFDDAEVVAIDSSAFMLDRLHASARAQGLTGRMRGVQADLDLAWPDVGTIDFAWAAASLHHFVDPDRVLRDVHAALNPGGVIVVIEMDSLPRFLPEDIGLGRPGLEARCHAAMGRAGWNAHPDWRPYLERAGFERAEHRRFTLEAVAAPGAEGYARRFLSQMRASLSDRLATDDLTALDRLLANDSPSAPLRRELTLHSSRTAWVATRCAEPGDLPHGRRV